MDPENFLIDLATGPPPAPGVITPVAPPTEFRLFAAGDNPTTKGLFKFTDLSQKEVPKRSQDWGTEHSIDYSHAALRASDAPDPSQAGKAAGWYTLEIRDGALWATNVRWTPKAAEAVSQGEWRYVSPAFLHNRDNVVLEFRNVALTNLPATKNMAPLTQLEADAVETNETETNKMDKALLIALGLSESATEMEALTRVSMVSAIVSKLSEATGKTGADMVAQALTWRDQAAQATARLAKLEAAQLEADIKLAKEQFRLAPAQEAWARKLAAKDPDALREFLEAAPVQVRAESNSATGANRTTEPAAQLTATEKKICELTGVSVAEFIKTRDAMVSAEGAI